MWMLSSSVIMEWLMDTIQSKTISWPRRSALQNIFSTEHTGQHRRCCLSVHGRKEGLNKNTICPKPEWGPIINNMILVKSCCWIRKWDNIIYQSEKLKVSQNFCQDEIGRDSMNFSITSFFFSVVVRIVECFDWRDDCDAEIWDAPTTSQKNIKTKLSGKFAPKIRS